MPLLLALIWCLPRVGLDLHFFYQSASPRFNAELPLVDNQEKKKMKGKQVVVRGHDIVD
jgi:hypothetical protein